MSDNTPRDLESPERPHASPTNCPTCDDPITAITTRGPHTHVAQPCGCAVSQKHLPTPPVADGGVRYTDLYAFQRDALLAVYQLETDQESPPKGVTILKTLTGQYGEELNHGRLYQTLDSLADRGLITKGTRNQRANEYATTAAGRTLLQERARRLTQLLDPPTEHLDPELPA